LAKLVKPVDRFNPRIAVSRAFAAAPHFCASINFFFRDGFSSCGTRIPIESRTPYGVGVYGNGSDFRENCGTAGAKKSR
jgi:hypothetical protein